MHTSVGMFSAVTYMNLIQACVWHDDKTSQMTYWTLHTYVTAERFLQSRKPFYCSCALNRCESVRETLTKVNTQLSELWKWDVCVTDSQQIWSIFVVLDWTDHIFTHEPIIQGCEATVEKSCNWRWGFFLRNVTRFVTIRSRSKQPLW